MQFSVIFLLFFLFNFSAVAQNCYDYGCVIQKVKRALQSSNINYNITFDNLESAAAYPNSKSEEISTLRRRLFERIQAEKKRAEKAEEQTKIVLRQVQAEKKNAENLRLVAENAEKSALAEKAKTNTTAEVYRIAALVPEIEKESPILAMKLANYAYQLSDQTNLLAAKIRSNLYQNVNIRYGRMKLIGHTSSVNSAVFSPDGNSILTGSSDNTAILWKDLITVYFNEKDRVDFTYEECKDYKIPFSDYHVIRNSGIIGLYAQAFQNKAEDQEAKIAIPYLNTAKGVLEYLVKERNKAYQGGLAEVYQALGQQYAKAGNPTTMMQHYEKAEQIYRSLIQEGNAIAYNKKQLQALYEDWVEKLTDLGMTDKAAEIEKRKEQSDLEKQ